MSSTDPRQRISDFLSFRAEKHYSKEKCGKCAQMVRQAVEFGIGKTIGRTLSAKDYGKIYESEGFKKIFSYPENSKDDYRPLKGDICIIQPVKTIKEGKEVIIQPHGHICAFTGKNWISDFIQNDIYGGPIREKNPPFAIYRLKDV